MQQIVLKWFGSLSQLTLRSWFILVTMMHFCTSNLTEWFLQGMACRPNTHRPSFHVNMVGLEKTQRSNSSRFPWDLDAEMIDEDEEEFELWLQQALASGLFCETSKRRKSWSPFKLPQKKSKRQWRRSSTWILDEMHLWRISAFQLKGKIITLQQRRKLFEGEEKEKGRGKEGKDFKKWKEKLGFWYVILSPTSIDA